MLKPLHPANLLRQYLEQKKTQPVHSAEGRVDLLEISPLLPWLIVVEDKGDGTELDLRIKFAGPSIAGILGVDPTGTKLSEGIPAELAETIRRECVHAQLSRQPRYAKEIVVIPGMSKKQVVLSIHPLSKSAGLTMDQIFWTMAPVDTEIETTIRALNS